MAKQIKILKCPNCSSVDKTEIKTDFYRCNSCGTEYFLDNDDININHNHTYNHSNQSTTTNINPLKIAGIAIGIILVAWFFLFIAASFFDNKTPNTDSTYTTTTSTNTEEEEKENTFQASRYWSANFLQLNNQQPIIVILENRSYKSDANKKKDGIYIAFYNLIKKELVAEQKMGSESMSASDFKLRTFSDGNIYIVNDKTTFWKLDKENLKIEEVGKTFFEANKELEIGVATIEFVYENAGDGLILLTNDGKKRYYYPLINKLYTEDEYYKASHGFKSLLPNAKEKTNFLFTSKSLEYPEDKLQLIKIVYKDNAAAPKDITSHVSWGKDYGGSGIFTERDPYKKVLLNNWNIESGRIVSWKDITPDRLYFAPSVLINEEEMLIIQFRADANTKSGFKFQQIDTENGNIIWTSALKEGNKFEHLIKYKDGFVGIDSNDLIIILDNNGNTVVAYKLD